MKDNPQQAIARRIAKLTLAMAAFAQLLAVAPAAFAQAAGRDYPSRPIRIVVAYSAGTASDTMARAMTDELAKQMGVGADRKLSHF